MKDAYIIGAGGFAKEVYLILKRTKKYNFKGFVNFQPENEIIRVGDGDFKVFEEGYFLENVRPSEQVVVFIGMGDPEIIKKVAQKFKNYVFPNLISPCVELDESIKLGVGNIITKGVNFTVDTTIGSFNVFNLNMTIGHDCVIGSYNVMNPGATISGSVAIGECNLLGTGATILQNLNIGNNNVIGGNGLLSKSVSDGKVLVGVPCKELVKQNQ